MDEYTMSAFALYPDGSSGDAFAEVCANSLAACFGAMAAEVAAWLPRALAEGEGTAPPRAVELTLEWSGAPAPAPTPAEPPGPRDPVRCRPEPSRGSMRRFVRCRVRCGVPAPAPLGPSLRGAPRGARA